MGAISCRYRSWSALTKPHTDAVYGFDDAQAAEISRLGTDVANVTIDGAPGHFRVAAVNGIDKLVAVEHLCAFADQRFQQREFSRCEVQRFVVKARSMASWIKA